MRMQGRDFSGRREAPSRRRALGLIASAPLLLPGRGEAQTDWPSKSVRVVSPSTGGITDTHCAHRVRGAVERLGQRFYVDGKPGAGGGISAQIAARSPADGYTLLFCIASLIVTNPFVYANALYDTDRDFDPVALLAWAPFAILVREACRSVRCRTGGLHSRPSRQGDVCQRIARQPGASRRRAVAAEDRRPRRDGAIPQRAANHPGAVGRRDGCVRSADRRGKGGHRRRQDPRPRRDHARARVEALPEVPTLEEQGFPGFDVAGWYGVLAPKGTPRPIVEKLNRELNAVITNPAYRERVVGMGAVAAEPLTPEAFGDSYRAEADQWGSLIRKIGLQLD